MTNYEACKADAWNVYLGSLVTKFKFPEEVVINASGLVEVLSSVMGKKIPVYATATADSLYLGWDFDLFTLVVIIYPKNMIFWQCYSYLTESTIEGYCEITNFPSQEFLDWFDKLVENLTQETYRKQKKSLKKR